MLPVTIILIASVQAAVSSNCSNMSTCLQCASMPNGHVTIKCMWCPISETCVPVDSDECLIADGIVDVLKCSSRPAAGYTYSDAFARNIMMPLSAAAYSNDPQPCLTNAIDNAKLRRQVLALCDSFEAQTCSGFTAVSGAHSAIIIAFRGTTRKVQLMSEVRETMMDSLVPLDGVGKVNKYFYKALMRVWGAGMNEDFLALKQKYPGYELWVTGHSLGASMASIAATLLARNGLFDAKRIKLVTFGQPRTGDYLFAAEHDKLLPYTYRVIHKADPIPHAPLKYYKGYYHHLYEVWYNNNMALGQPYMVCPQPESEECSDSLTTNDYYPDDHLYYFGKHVSVFGHAGCTNATEEPEEPPKDYSDFTFDYEDDPY